MKKANGTSTPLTGWLVLFCLVHAGSVAAV